MWEGWRIPLNQGLGCGWGQWPGLARFPRAGPPSRIKPAGALACSLMSELSSCIRCLVRACGCGKWIWTRCGDWGQGEVVWSENKGGPTNQSTCTACHASHLTYCGFKTMGPRRLWARNRTDLYPPQAPTLHMVDLPTPGGPTNTKLAAGLLPARGEEDRAGAPVPRPVSIGTWAARAWASWGPPMSRHRRTAPATARTAACTAHGCRYEWR